VKKIRVMIVDDHALLREGLATLIKGQRDMALVGQADSGVKAVALAATAKPDVVLLDLAMPEGPGLDAIPGIKSVHPAARVLVMTMYDDLERLQAVMNAGGAGFITKSAAGAELLTAIRAVNGGKSYFAISLNGAGRDAMPLGLNPVPLSVDPTLSGREKEVLTRVAGGLTNKEIAHELRISVKTVETYRSRFVEKLGLRSRAEVVRYAIDTGLLGRR
jgi:two-component system response regulator NreC